MIKFNKKMKDLCIAKNNRLCIGLDIDNEKLPNQSIDYMKGFILDIIEATVDICPIYKINFSFYEKLGSKGYNLLEFIPEMINNRAITIADSKRGDIGNSSKYYAKAVFETLAYDSITVNPYMGGDSLRPFIEYNDKGIFILCLTSNIGSSDFQKLQYNGKALYEHVAMKAESLNENENIGIVLGASNSDYFKQIKNITKKLPWLMPGVGFQGGNLSDSIKIEGDNGLSIINVSRGIIYAGNGSIDEIRKSAMEYTKKIREII